LAGPAFALFPHNEPCGDAGPRDGRGAPGPAGSWWRPR
jgi:hypothetical protein